LYCVNTTIYSSQNIFIPLYIVLLLFFKIW